MNKIVLDRPAVKWRQALPAGNGHMGAMVYGGIEQERIELTENTFYSGEALEKNEKGSGKEAFYQMREEIGQGAYEKAHQTAEAFIGSRGNYGTNLPVGTLELIFSAEKKAVTQYKRELSLERGVISCEFETDEGSIRRDLWISHPAHVLVYEINTSFSGSCRLQYHNSNAFGRIEYREHQIAFTARAWEEMHCDKKTGTSLGGCLCVVTDGIVRNGEDNSGLLITDSRHTVLYLAMETDFSLCHNKKTAKKTLPDLKRKAAERVEAAIKQGAETLLKEHEKDIKKQMERCTLWLEGEEPEIASLPVLFQYGRYLLLSSSRADSKLPAHLQGIWNDFVACRIGWTCDLHLDINTQMNYWPSEVTGLEECVRPLCSLIRNRLVPEGRKTAHDFYGLTGWVTELVTNAWGYTAPYWAVPLAPCPTGGVWLVTHLWEHYCYGEDLDFLKQELLPAVEEASAFFTEYVYRLPDGSFESGPSVSPENSFVLEEKHYQISNSCTYEILMIRELLSIYLAIDRLLPGRCKPALRNKAEEICKNLPPYRILPDGTIAEWNHDYPAADPQHRHTSHLLGLFPFSQITPEKTKELALAAERTIQKKLQPEEGFEDTGWARSMLMLYQARLGNPEECEKYIKKMRSSLLSENGFVMHPPTRGAAAFDDVYELDGNTGLTACIAEMLMQSHEGVIRLLPALPAAWQTGAVKGLRARGGVTVSIQWKNAKLQEASFYSERSKQIVISYQGKSEKINLKEKESVLYQSCAR